MNALEKNAITRQTLKEMLEDSENTIYDERAILRVLSLMGEGSV